jgi:uncharacterized protein
MFKKILFFLLLFPLLIQAQDIPEKPNPPRLVNDFVGGLLSQSQIDALERKLVAYNDSTSTQIVIVIVKSVQPYDISDYAFKLGTKWGVGQKGKDNGIIIVWAPGDRKIFIATGRGLEGAITDAYSRRIIEQIIKPNFKNLQYYEGLDQGTDKIINYAKGEFEADPNAGGKEDISFGAILMIIFFIIIILWFIRRSGGGRGGRGGGFVPFVTYSNWGSSSGSWGGGDSGGGGGFGGFGGGDFGGGGAGGDY